MTERKVMKKSRRRASLACLQSKEVTEPEKVDEEKGWAMKPKR